ALFAIARSCEGCMRDAEGMLDQLISFCGDKIQESDVLAMFGITSAVKVSELAQAIIDSAPDKALKLLNDLSNSGKELTRLVSDLLSHFRNILVLKVSKGDTSLLDVTEEELKILNQQASALTPEVLTRIMDTISECETQLRDAVSRKALVEITLVKAIQERSAISADALLKHLQRLREETAAGGGTLNQIAFDRKESESACLKETPTSPEAPAYAGIKEQVQSEKETAEETEPILAQETEQPPQSLSPLQKLWEQMLKLSRKNSLFLYNCLKNCEPVSIQDNSLTIAVGEEINIELLNDEKSQKSIAQILSEIGYSGYKTKFIRKDKQLVREQIASEPPQQTPQPKKSVAAPVLEKTVEEKPLNFDDFKNDPLIKEALERFRGRIIDIKKKS
ncbi:MAG: hypothetical protein ACPMAG_07435, partial [Limisphaerales bacterium]